MAGLVTVHARNAIGALGQLSRQPVATLLTVAVIGIALALPASLQLLVQSGQSIAGNWRDIRDFSIYLKPGASLDQARDLARSVAGNKLIRDTRLIDADAALAGFREDPAFGDVVDALTSNPLPHTVVVRPDPGASTADLQALKEELARRPEVDLVQLDTRWLARLAAILDFVRRLVWIAGVMLVAAVIVIVGNTIRLDIQNRRQEIEVSKLLGATDAFVRRPFLYIGFWYGLLGGMLALALLAVSLLQLSGPVDTLLRLYGAQFDGFSLTGRAALTVLGGGLLAGCAGAWVAVGRHLSAIEPHV